MSGAPSTTREAAAPRAGPRRSVERGLGAVVPRCRRSNRCLGVADDVRDLVAAVNGCACVVDHMVDRARSPVQRTPSARRGACTPGVSGTSKAWVAWSDRVRRCEDVAARYPSPRAPAPSHPPCRPRTPCDAVVLQAAWSGASYGISFWKKIVRPRSPFQITSYFWKCSTNRPVAVTSSPLTITPVSAVFAVQPTPVAVVGAPGPDVVEDRRVAVDLEAVVALPDVRRRRCGRRRPEPVGSVGARRGCCSLPACRPAAAPAS